MLRIKDSIRSCKGSRTQMQVFFCSFGVYAMCSLCNARFCCFLVVFVTALSSDIIALAHHIIASESAICK